MRWCLVGAQSGALKSLASDAERSARCLTIAVTMTMGLAEARLDDNSTHSTQSGHSASTATTVDRSDKRKLKMKLNKRMSMNSEPRNQCKEYDFEFESETIRNEWHKSMETIIKSLK